jgi:excisionase family DNA binding protein
MSRTLAVETIPPLLPYARAADLAGVSIQTVRRWVREGRVRAGRPGGRSGGRFGASGGSARGVIVTSDLLTLLGLGDLAESITKPPARRCRQLKRRTKR